MPRRRRWFLWAGVVCLGISGGTAWYLMRVSPEAAALRKKFAYVSLSDRLSYERRNDAPGDDRREPNLLGQAIKRLEANEEFEPQRWLFGNGARMESLKKLHSREATRFVNSPGNGKARFGRNPSPDWLDYREPAPIPLAEESPKSADELADEVLTLKENEVQEEPGGMWAPSLNLLGSFHDDNEWLFTDPWRFGHVIDRDHVAGFVSHGFSELPELKHPQNKRNWVAKERKYVETHQAPWKIVRLELVSLLKFDKPAVYVSDHLPQMSELADATTRPLTPFEQQALESLQAGEYLVAAAGTNHIRMLGSLRASKQCLQCHSGRRGTLLGAFSYRLRRDPPLAVTRSGKIPAT